MPHALTSCVIAASRTSSERGQPYLDIAIGRPTVWFGLHAPQIRDDGPW
jgi:hypothetical protein